jgi:hypothetical protein
VLAHLLNMPPRGLAAVDQLLAELVLADVGGLARAVVGPNVETKKNRSAKHAAGALATLNFELHRIPPDKDTLEVWR